MVSRVMRFAMTRFDFNCNTFIKFLSSGVTETWAVQTENESRPCRKDFMYGKLTIGGAEEKDRKANYGGRLSEPRLSVHQDFSGSIEGGC